MTCYFFDIDDGAVHLDDVGTELAGTAEAKMEAVRLFSGLLNDDPELLGSNRNWSVSVRDAKHVLFSFVFGMTEGLASFRHVPNH